MDGFNICIKQPSEITRITLSECIATGEIALDLVIYDDVYKGINDNGRVLYLRKIIFHQIMIHKFINGLNMYTPNQKMKHQLEGIE